MRSKRPKLLSNRAKSEPHSCGYSLDLRRVLHCLDWRFFWAILCDPRFRHPATDRVGFVALCYLAHLPWSRPNLVSEFFFPVSSVARIAAFALDRADSLSIRRRDIYSSRSE